MAESARRIVSGGLHIDQRLYALVAEQIAPGTDVDVDHFWAALGKIVEDLGPKNQQLLQRRDSTSGTCRSATSKRNATGHFSILWIVAVNIPKTGWCDQFYVCRSTDLIEFVLIIQRMFLPQLY